MLWTEYLRLVSISCHGSYIYNADKNDPQFQREFYNGRTLTKFRDMLGKLQYHLSSLRIEKQKYFKWWCSTLKNSVNVMIRELGASEDQLKLKLYNIDQGHSQFQWEFYNIWSSTCDHQIPIGGKLQCELRLWSSLWIVRAIRIDPHLCTDMRRESISI